MLSGVEAIVTKHFKLSFWDVTDEPGNEFHCRNALGNSFFIFMSCIVKGYVFTIIVINARGSNYRPTKVSADVFNGNRRCATIRLCTDIKSIGMIFVNIVFNSSKRRTQTKGQFFKKDFSESITKKSKIEMSNFAPRSKVTSGTFRNEGMDVRIPF